MKRVKFIGLLVIALMMGLAVGTSAEKDGPTIWLVPHQDDEILTYGVSILHHEYSGHENHVVLLTDGSGSGARKTVGNKVGYELTKEQFSEARTKEFKRSAAILGVKEEHIHIRDYVDGQLTVQDVRDTVNELLQTYPNARFKAMSYYDAHPDHAETGVALQQMYDEGILTDVRFYFKPSQFNITELRGPGVIVNKATEEQVPYILASIQTYNRWNPEQGWFAIGNTSVRKSFEQLKNNLESAYHLPNYELPK